MFGRTLTSTAWGMAADRIGRKLVIVLTIFSMLVLLFSIFIKSKLSYLLVRACISIAYFCPTLIICALLLSQACV
jgi:MFS family permease